MDWRKEISCVYKINGVESVQRDILSANKAVSELHSFLIPSPINNICALDVQRTKIDKLTIVGQSGLKHDI